LPPAHCTVPGASEEIPAGQTESSILLGVFGYWLELFDETVRTTVSSIEKVRVVGVQSIWTHLSIAHHSRESTNKAYSIIVPIRIGVRTDWVGLSVARCGWHYKFSIDHIAGRLDSRMLPCQNQLLWACLVLFPGPKNRFEMIFYTKTKIKVLTLPVDLVVNVAHRDEGSDHTRPTTSFDC
jgi:hypothetical protein